jgi:F0F1-type ATP synthase epsilon subunit
MPDSGALGVLTTREPQVQALQKLDSIVKINCTNTRNYYIRFGKGLAIAQGTITINTLLKPITFHIILANTLFLYYI